MDVLKNIKVLWCNVSIKKESYCAVEQEIVFDCDFIERRDLKWYYHIV